jgi:cytochrome c-type biogenesis protein CcmE
MRPRAKLLLGGALALAALGYLIVGGVREAAVYYLTPTELRAQGPAADRAIRVGGLVVPGSLRWEPATLALRFRLTDGVTEVAVEHTGTPPDLFKEGTGAIVEGTWGPDRIRARTILAKHSEEYRPPAPGAPPPRPLAPPREGRR